MPVTKHGWRSTLGIALASIVGLGGMVVPSAPAQAATRPLFQLPFKCGEQYQLATYKDHDDYDIDMTPTSGNQWGRPILASYDGVVQSAGIDGTLGNRTPSNPYGTVGTGGGYFVRLDHGGGWDTLYLHMLEPPLVRAGQRVVRGQQIGKVGSTGQSYGPHLHYEQKLNNGTVQSYFNGRPSGITHDNYPYSVTRRSFNCLRRVSVYGVLSDGRLTYTAMSADTAARVHGAVVSTQKLGFTPKAMATLNFNTILITSTAGALYRVDVITNNTELRFEQPVKLGDGWTHDLLTYDGSGHIFGIAAGALRRYNIPVSKAKPVASDITNYTLIGNGFTLKTLTGAGGNWILGTTSAGALLSYRIGGAGSWSRYELRSSTWGNMSHLVSPGAGIIYGRHSSGSMHAYLDPEPYDGAGSDLRSVRTIDSSGWTQILLSAYPFQV